MPYLVRKNQFGLALFIVVAVTLLLARGTQEFYDALELENSKIYISRARNVYSSMNMEDVSVFLFSMTGVKLHAMADPSMLGRDRLVASIADMDSIR